MREMGLSVLICFVASFSGCNTVATDAAENTSVMSKAPSRISSASNNLPQTNDPEELCKRLHEIRKMPYDRSQKADDPVYDGLMTAGVKAVPCLIELITDTQEPDNPEVIPEVEDLRVGDIAVFMLLDVTDQDWKPAEMLPPAYASRFKDEGIYAYLAFVQKPENRKIIQNWWKDWMKKNLNQQGVIIKPES